ncbi:Calcium sensing receptor [Hibiscus syriacus]|uniref:Calcium sensing receptor n=1 Tax=Hibiscus syriacus TaxID=106335 RepID=A0A6A2ZSW6_HIBSY|nr:Calcium sensing receptor [Hibiscus syriacus]
MEEMKKIPYSSVVGSLMYSMICTRPDIAYAVGVVSRFLANPGNEHWVTAKWILRYLRGTSKRCLCFGKGKHVLEEYTDANLASDIDLRKSTSGYITTFAGGVVSCLQGDVVDEEFVNGSGNRSRKVCKSGYPGFRVPEVSGTRIFGKRSLDDTVISWRDEGDDDLPVKSMTLKELQMEVVAHALDALGLDRGSAIAIDMPMNAYSVIIYLATVLAGYVVVSIAGSFAPPEISTRLKISEAKAIFTPDLVIRGEKILPLHSRVVEAHAPMAIVIPARSSTFSIKFLDGDISWPDFLERVKKFKGDVFKEVEQPVEAFTNILFSSGTTERMFIPKETRNPKYKFSIFAFVQFDNEASLKRAIDNLNGSLIDGRRITVGTARYKEARSRSVGKNSSLFITTKPNTEDTSNSKEKDVINQSLRDDRSYKDALLSNKLKSNVSDCREMSNRGVHRGKGMKNIWEMHIPSKSSSWVKRSLTGIIKNSFELELV